MLIITNILKIIIPFLMNQDARTIANILKITIILFSWKRRIW